MFNFYEDYIWNLLKNLKMKFKFDILKYLKIKNTLSFVWEHNYKIKYYKYETQTILGHINLFIYIPIIRSIYSSITKEK